VIQVVKETMDVASTVRRGCSVGVRPLFPLRVHQSAILIGNASKDNRIKVVGLVEKGLGTCTHKTKCQKKEKKEQGDAAQTSIDNKKKLTFLGRLACNGVHEGWNSSANKCWFTIE
jgi:hypothetical protein